MKRLLILDRDGTIIAEPPDEQVDSLDKLKFLDGAIANLSRIVRELKYELLIVTNQDGLGTGSFPEAHFWPAHNKMLDELKKNGIKFKDVLIDRSFEHEHAPTRKPRTGLLIEYINGPYDLKRSYVVGDRLTDVELAKNLGARAIWIKKDPGEKDRQTIGEKKLLPSLALTAERWDEVYQFLKKADNE